MGSSLAPSKKHSFKFEGSTLWKFSTLQCVKGETSAVGQSRSAGTGTGRPTPTEGNDKDHSCQNSATRYTIEMYCTILEMLRCTIERRASDSGHGRFAPSARGGGETPISVPSARCSLGRQIILNATKSVEILDTPAATARFASGPLRLERVNLRAPTLLLH